MSDSKEHKTVFDRVLYIGPDIKDKGGISSVLKSYSEHFPDFHFIASNSRYGFLPGAVNWLTLMVRLPFERMSGRKLLHLHGAMGKSWIRKNIIFRWGKMLGFKAVFHCHAHSAKESFARMGIEKARKALDRYDSIIALSEYWRDYFTQTFGLGHKTYKVNNIVARGPEPGKRADGPVRFLFLGELGHRKGIFDILKGIAELGLTGFHLTVGGNGETERFCSEVKRLGLDDRVEFVGWVTGARKDELLRDCDVLMLPSFNEGLPISILEAMANGKAVITTPVGGIPEVIENEVNGLMVNPGDSAAIGTAMQRYIAEPDLARRHGEASVERVSEFYPEAVRDRLAEIYAELLED